MIHRTNYYYSDKTGSRDKPYLLFVVPYLPSRFYPHEKNKLAFKSLKRAAVKHRVILAALLDSAEKPYLRGEDYSFCYRSFFIYIPEWRKVLNRLENLSIPFSVSEKIDTRMVDLMLELDKSYHFVSFLGENLLAAYYSLYLRDSVNKRVILHDVYSEQFASRMDNTGLINRAMGSGELDRLKNWERYILNTVDEVVVFNTYNAQTLEALGLESAIVLEEPVVSSKYKRLIRSESLLEKYSIIYWGSLAKTDNRSGIQWFLSDVFPYVREKYPMVKFYIVGANPPSDFESMLPSNVILTGFVVDPMAYFQKACLAVVPLRSGRGPRMKTLELISAHIPTVTTSIGAQGIDGSEYLYVEDDPMQFAGRINDLLSR